MIQQTRSRTAFPRRSFIQAAVASLLPLRLANEQTGAQQRAATPASGPAPGFLGGAERRFEASGMRLTGALVISTAAYAFDSETHAVEAFPSLIEHTRGAIETDASPLHEASAPPLGDEHAAYVGEVPGPDESSPRFAVGLVFWRDGDLIIVMFAGGLAGDQLAELVPTAQAIAGREPGPPTAATLVPGNMRSGGLWDVLPTLEDAPEGFVFLEDRIPR
jgi:hypothetical protein